MSSGSPDYYTPDAQLANSLIAFTEILGRLHTTTKNIDDVMDSLGANINTLTNDIKTLLTTLRSQAMGDSTSLHASGIGETGLSGAVKTIIAAWTGRTGFCVTNLGITTGRLYVGSSNSCGMATLPAYNTYTNESYCGLIKVKASADLVDYAFEEW